ncbi:MAG: copper resistance CopC/CopD family protein [Gemmatimonadaceae bacterium]
MSARRFILLALLALLVTPAPLRAHGALRRAEPAAGARLSVAPRFLRLTFNEAVEPAVARLELTGPGGRAVPLSRVRQGDSASVLTADIIGPLEAGLFVVAWQVVGRDGHPVRGHYRFTIAPGATGLGSMAPAAPAGPGVVAPPAIAPPAHAPAAIDSAAAARRAGTQHEVTAMTSSSEFGPESPLFVAVRWLGYAGMLVLIGAVGFLMLVVPRAGQRGVPGNSTTDAERGARRLGIAAAALLLVAAVLRLVAESVAMHGVPDAFDSGMIGAMLAHTLWGKAWLLQVAGALAAVAGFLASPRRRAVGWSLVVAATLALAVSAALSGHAAAVPGRVGLAVAADAVHMLAAGGWLGTLLLLVLVGVPAALRLAPGERGATVAALVTAFSPLALAFAATVAVTGAVSAWLHLGTLTALWTAPYGRTLLVKLGVLSVLAASGAYNWLHVRPALGDEAGAHRLRRSSSFELVVGAVVLLVTAVLVATPTPLDVVR